MSATGAGEDGRGRGRRIAGRYRLTSVVSAGGSGIVWAAFDEVLGREVAVKELKASPYRSESDQTPEPGDTLREARAAGRIDHRGVVHVYDIVEHDGWQWIVMQLVKAPSLAELIRRDGPRTPHQTAKLGLQLLDALRAAHELGVIHCDVKPSNILVRGDEAVLTDFGIAHIEGEAAPAVEDTLVGAPSYIAPECVRGAPATTASDLWALGATLYAAVEGRPPFHRDDPIATLSAVATADPDPIRWAGMLAPLLTNLLARDPAQRPDAEQVEHELRRLVALGEPADTRPAPAGEPLGDETTTSDFRALASTSARASSRASKSRSGEARRARRRAIAVAAVVAALTVLLLGMLPSRATVDAQPSPVAGLHADAVSPTEPDPAEPDPAVVDPAVVDPADLDPADLDPAESQPYVGAPSAAGAAAQVEPAAVAAPADIGAPPKKRKGKGPARPPGKVGQETAQGP